MKDILINTLDWLLSDQYDFGEFGQHEIINPTDLPRTFETSLMKPNIFSSIYAYYALIATGNVPADTLSRFFGWVERIRSSEGYWTSASGAVMPFGDRKGWARNKNLRHTAKCLDLYFLCRRFSYQDASIFCEIISNQLECGAYPQFINGQPDIWSTAYFVNLLNRASMDHYLQLTRPRDKGSLAWKNELTSHLNRAVDWLIYQIAAEDKLWHINGGNSISVSLAMMVEIGGYLAMYRAAQCKEIVETLLGMKVYNYTLLYVACLTLDTLENYDQKKILSDIESVADKFDNNQPLSDLLEVVSLCRLSFIGKNIGAIRYRRNTCNGHESLLASDSTWDNGEYMSWCVNKFIEGKALNTQNPTQECEFWEQIKQYIHMFKNSVENSRGWELLWKDYSPVNEKTVQTYFDIQLRGICQQTNVSFTRESETGRGPIDFVFSNGFRNSILIEIKLAANQALNNGTFCAQIYEYLKGMGQHTAFLIIVGYHTREKGVMDEVDAHISRFLESHSDFYIYPMFIDAQRRKGASKASLTG